MSDATEKQINKIQREVDEEIAQEEQPKKSKLAERLKERRAKESLTKEGTQEESLPEETPKKAVKNTFTQVGGDGALETYNDPFAIVTEEMQKQAQEIEQRVLETNGKVTGSYLRMARDLSTFKANKLYLARGFESFQAWGESPELAQVGWRTMYDLVRIADEVLPMMERNNLLDEIPSISNLYALLPILNDDDGEEKFLKALAAIKGQSVRDAKETIREIRGISGKESKTQATYFNFRVDNQTEDYKKGVLLSGLGGETAYEMGTLRIAAKDWAAFEKMVGEKNVIWPKS